MLRYISTCVYLRFTAVLRPKQVKLLNYIKIREKSENFRQASFI